jgi:hypothetical protein
MRERVKRQILTLGRPVRCEDCGETLFRVLPLPWRGGLMLVGAEHALVRVDWSSMNQLVFRHVEREYCRHP